MKFGIRVRLKPFNDRGEFELDRTKNKNNIAENSIAIGYDTHNRLNIQVTQKCYTEMESSVLISSK